MKRGEVWEVNFEPSVGWKKRPAVIISNDAANKYLNRVQVVLLTTRVGHIYPGEAVVMLRQSNKAMADQLTTVSRLRLINRVGGLTNADGRNEHVVKVALALPDQPCKPDCISQLGAFTGGYLLDRMSRM